MGSGEPATLQPVGSGRGELARSFDARSITDGRDRPRGRAQPTVESVAASLDTVLADPSRTASVDEFADDEVVLRSHYWIAKPDRTAEVATRSTFARRLASRFQAAGITISPAAQRELSGHIGIAGQDRPLALHPND